MKVPAIRKKYFAKEAFLERRLPAPGKIIVSVGDSLKPYDFVGEAELSLRRETVPLAKVLGVRKEKLPRVLLKKEGQDFGRSELIASSSSFLGLGGKVFRAPFPGRVEKIDRARGEVVLRNFPEQFRLTAGAKGIVFKIIPGKAVLLKVSAAVIRGVFAYGRSVEGELIVLGKFNTPLGLEQLGSSLSGRIVVAGSFASPEVIAKALAIGVKGMVVGGVNYLRGQRLFAGEDFSLLVTEGFGELPLEPSCWSYLKSVEARHTLLVPERKELLVPETEPHDGVGEEGGGFVELGVGKRVEIFSWPYLARTGRVVKIGDQPVKFPSEIKALAVKVKLEDTGEEVEVPLRNVGVLV